MKSYDYKKAKKFIDENSHKIKSASLGMHEDWFWTAETVFENGEYEIKLGKRLLKIGGINSSEWATPTLEIVYKNGRRKMIPCFIDDGKVSERSKPFMPLGCMSQPVQDKITPLSKPI